MTLTRAVGAAAAVIMIGVAATGCGIVNRVLPTQQSTPTPTVPKQLAEPLNFHPVVSGQPGECEADANDVIFDTRAEACLTLEPSRLTVDQLAAVSLEPGNADWTVQIGLAEEDAKTFAALSSAAAEEEPPLNQIAMVLGDLPDAEFLTAPTVVSPITDGRVQISGGLTRDDAEALVQSLGG